MPDFVSTGLNKSTHNIGREHGGRGTKRAMAWSLFDSRGRRKYLVPRERKRFLEAALAVGGKTASLCAVLVFCGPRISEALALTPDAIDDGNCAINFLTLKRRSTVIRAAPVPRAMLDLLDAVHCYREARGDPARRIERLWPCSRTTAWRRVRRILTAADIAGHQASPKSLRHAFGAAGTLNGVSLAMIQKWLGHADVRTTTIYSTVIGREERTLARHVWKDLVGALQERNDLTQED